MAKIYRPFYFEFWDDDKLPFKSNAFRLVFIHVVWNKFSTPLGIFSADLEALHANFNKNKEMPFGTYKETFEEGLGEGYWQHSPKVGVTFIEQWWKADHPRNRPANPNILKSWFAFLDDIPECELKTIAIDRVKTFAEGWGKPFVKVCETLPQTLPQTFRDGYPKPMPNMNYELGSMKKEKKDKSFPDQKTKAVGADVENSMEKKTNPDRKSRHFELMDKAVRTFKLKYPKSKITPAQVSILAYGRGGGRKGPCFGELDVVVELFKQMPADLTDPVRFAMKMASEPEWISKCTKAVETQKEWSGVIINKTEPERMDFASVLPAKPVEVE